MNLIKTTQGISFTKIGLMIVGVCQGLLSAGIDIVPGSTVDETVLKIGVIVGGVLAGNGLRDAIAKGGK